jgi:RNA polymerase sigma factor (sigma-70 family)
MEKTNNLFHADYIERLKARNSAIEEHFVCYFRPRLRSLLWRNGARVDEVEDLQQETFVRVLATIESCKAIHFPERFGGFVGAVCQNTLRERFRRDKHYAELDDSASTVPDERQDQHALLLAQERGKIVRRIISRLSPRDQAVLRAAFWEQKSTGEICRELGLSRGCVRLLLYRAKRRFEEQMNGDERKQFRNSSCMSRESKSKSGEER